MHLMPLTEMNSGMGCYCAKQQVVLSLQVSWGLGHFLTKEGLDGTLELLSKLCAMISQHSMLTEKSLIKKI